MSIASAQVVKSILSGLGNFSPRLTERGINDAVDAGDLLGKTIYRITAQFINMPGIDVVNISHHARMVDKLSEEYALELNSLKFYDANNMLCDPDTKVYIVPMLMGFHVNTSMWASFGCHVSTPSPINNHKGETEWIVDVPGEFIKNNISITLNFRKLSRRYWVQEAYPLISDLWSSKFAIKGVMKAKLGLMSMRTYVLPVNEKFLPVPEQLLKMLQMHCVTERVQDMLFTANRAYARWREHAYLISRTLSRTEDVQDLLDVYRKNFKAQGAEITYGETAFAYNTIRGICDSIPTLDDEDKLRLIIALGHDWYKIFA